MSIDALEETLVSELKNKSIENWYYKFEILAKTGLLLGGFFAVIEFYSAVDAKRIDRTLNYVEKFESGSISNARRLLRSKTRPYYKQFSNIGKEGLTEEDKKQITLLLIEDDDDGSIADSLEIIVDFFEGLMLCTDENICARSVTEAYFCPVRAESFWENYSPYILDRRTNNPSFGKALERCAIK